MLQRALTKGQSTSVLRTVVAFGQNKRSFATPQKMTASEAFVETLAAHGAKDCFGIVGSAFMDALDLFPEAGIRFISVQHEQNAAHMADGYSRVSGQHGYCIAQNGPGITNFVTGVAAAFWAHSPVVAITPEAGSLTKGLGGFQEVDQLPLFQPITKYQAHVNHPARIAELTARALDIALRERGPVQINIPRDMFYSETNYSIPPPQPLEPTAGGLQSLKEAAELLLNAKRPVILAGGGVTLSRAGPIVAQLADKLSVPVAVSFLHNDAFPSAHPLAVGPLGYQGSQAAMHLIKDADVVLALGTRLGPFSTTPQYGFDYWPTNTAKLIQIDANPRNLNLTRPADLAINGDARLAAQEILSHITSLINNFSSSQKTSFLSSATDRQQRVAAAKAKWTSTLDDMTFSLPHGGSGLCKPRHALRELEKALPHNAVVATDVGNICSVSNSYLKFGKDWNGATTDPSSSCYDPSFLAAMTFGNCGYSFPAAIGAKVAKPNRPVFSYVGDGAWGMSLNEVLTCVREKIPVTAVVFNNQQWGAEKKNQVLWFGDRYLGVNLENPSFAAIAKSMSAEGIVCSNESQIGDALKKATKDQLENGKTTVIEVLCTRELGDPFRRDAMKLPVRLLPKYQSTTCKSESPTGQPTDIQVPLK
eukprot:TRINITY_DN4611_c0_g1_i1.p1 TRINITY_DN4611_c0_g1~~TRINITY_DN4611_c0_g1_i1.p1  ORF type:complete len:696 (-),score=276.28 TRINITY_DN4611_c0_g1_i1:84-2027(-)